MRVVAQLRLLCELKMGVLTSSREQKSNETKTVMKKNLKWEDLVLK